MMLSVPVGAIVVRVELRSGIGPSLPPGPYNDCPHSGKLPRTAARLCEAASASR